VWVSFGKRSHITVSTHKTLRIDVQDNAKGLDFSRPSRRSLCALRLKDSYRKGRKALPQKSAEKGAQSETAPTELLIYLQLPSRHLY
jgi:hypothetical protein